MLQRSYYTKSFLPKRVRFFDKSLIAAQPKKWNLFVHKSSHASPEWLVPNTAQRLFWPRSLNSVIR